MLSCLVNYFAYGSNLNSDVLKRRTVNLSNIFEQRVISSFPGVCLHHVIQYDVGPLYGPNFASIRPSVGDSCHGVLYTLSDIDFLALCASEGVPVAYLPTVIKVTPYDASKLETSAITFRSTINKKVSKPSRRYLDLIIRGARNQNLDFKYIEYLENTETYW